jgi:hypothetical protein
MRIERLHGWVIPVVLAVVVADVNFFLDAAISDRADVVGVIFFVLFGLYGLQSLWTRRDPGMIVSVLGAAVALAMMLLRETEVWDHGYIPPYVVFIVFVLVAQALRGSRRAEA